MNVIMRNTILSVFALLLLLAIPQGALALSIDAYEVGPDDASIASWLSGYPGFRIIEDFEDIDLEGNPEKWYDTLSTDVGTFTATGSAGTGDASHPDGDVKFKVVDESDSGSNTFGRVNTGSGDSQYLDSADITEIELSLTSGLRDMYFYMSDPGDIGATTTTTVDDGASISIPAGQDDGSLWFVGISTDIGDGDLSKIAWSTGDHTNDGYGLDDFSTSVPEPATLLLLGTGLVGFAGFARRRRSSRS